LSSSWGGRGRWGGRARERGSLPCLPPLLLPHLQRVRHLLPRLVLTHDRMAAAQRDGGGEARERGGDAAHGEPRPRRRPPVGLAKRGVIGGEGGVVRWRVVARGGGAERVHGEPRRRDARVRGGGRHPPGRRHDEHSAKVVPRRGGRGQERAGAAVECGWPRGRPAREHWWAAAGQGHDDGPGRGRALRRGVSSGVRRRRWPTVQRARPRPPPRPAGSSPATPTATCGRPVAAAARAPLDAAAPPRGVGRRRRPPGPFHGQREIYGGDGAARQVHR
jgi:hypothetical protein